MGPGPEVNRTVPADGDGRRSLLHRDVGQSGVDPDDTEARREGVNDRPEVRERQRGDGERVKVSDPDRPGHPLDVEPLAQLRSEVLPLGGRPGLGGTVGLGHEEHGAVEPGHRRGQKRHRRREVDVDTEVSGDPVEYLVDVEQPDRRLELGRAPPIVPLERMVAEIDQPVCAGHRWECLLVHATGETGDPFGKARLRVRPCHQPGLVTPSATVGDQSLDDRERNDQVPEPEGNRRHVDPGHLLSGPRRRSDRPVPTRRTPGAARRTCCSARSVRLPGDRCTRR